jgi:large subunit ribosomal protein L19e
MSIKLTKRVASDIMNRGVSAIRISPERIEDAQKAITREDVRGLIKSGVIYAVEPKHNKSMRSVLLREKRTKGRRRGIGRKRGTKNARSSMTHKKKIRGQRRVLLALKKDNSMDNAAFKVFYRLVRGGTFASKASLINHIKSKGIVISNEKMEQLKHI